MENRESERIVLKMEVKGSSSCRESCTNLLKESFRVVNMPWAILGMSHENASVYMVLPTQPGPCKCDPLVLPTGGTKGT